MSRVSRHLAAKPVRNLTNVFAQLALQFGRVVVQNYNSFRNAEKQASVNQIAIDIHFNELEADLFFLEQKSASFTPAVRESLEALLHVLLKDLEAVIIVFSYARGSDGKIKRGRWVLDLQRSLENLVQNIEDWQRRFTGYISLLSLTGYGSKDSEISLNRTTSQSRADSLRRRLTSAITQGPPNIDGLYMQSLPLLDQDLEKVPHSMLRIPRASASRRDFVVESRRYERTDNPKDVRSIVGYTAQILSASDARTMHVLSCEGYTHRENLMRFDIMLKFPPGTGSPRTLRDMLLDPNLPEPSINTRLALCKQIATAALYIHAASLVHKSIRPENILLLQQIPVGPKTAREAKLGIPFLVGFENIRKERPDWYSSLRVNNRWERDLYSHPSRQGQPTEKYTMAHDVYSIGVVLYEIALWQCFLTWDDVILDYNIDAEVLPGGRSIIRKIKETRPGAGEELKALYEQLAREELPNVMGDRFSEIVLSCLSAVEDGLAGEMGTDGEVQGGEVDEGLGEEAQKVGLTYIKTILDAFERISI
jgi:hypothetical protein